MNVPVSKIVSIATTVVLSAATTLYSQYQQKKAIESVGQRIGREIVKQTKYRRYY